MREIENGIPIARRKEPEFPELLVLEVGQSFLVEPESVKRAERCVWQQHRSRKDRRYTTRTRCNGLRIWRTA